MRLARSITLVCLLLPLSFGVSAQPPRPRTVHIAVRVFDFNGEPVGSLSSANFRLDGAAAMPLSLTFSPVPVHLLVLLSPGQGELGSARTPSLVGELKPLWTAGWSISIRDADGRQTGYTSRQGEMLTAARRPAVSGVSVAAAIGTLAEFPERRIVFVITGSNFDVDDITAQQARRFHAMLYRIGAPSSNRYQPGFNLPDTILTEFTGSGDGIVAAAVFPGGSSPASPPTPYIHQETSLRNALRDALKDSSGFYDLRAQLPGGTSNVRLSVLPSEANGASYRLTAQPYTEDATPPPTLTLLTP